MQQVGCFSAQVYSLLSLGLISDNRTPSQQSLRKESQRALRDGKRPRKGRLNKEPCSRHWD